MVKVFAFNKTGKLEFTKEELEHVLNEAWNDGYNAGRLAGYTYTSPSINSPNWWDNVKYTCSTINTEENK